MRRAALAVVACLALAAPATAAQETQDGPIGRRPGWLARWPVRPGASRPTPSSPCAPQAARRRRCGRAFARSRGSRRLRPHRGRRRQGRPGRRRGGRRPLRLGGVDYVARIRARYASGRYGATAYDQALSILGLRAAERPVPSAALRATLAGRGAGGWSFDLSQAGGTRWTPPPW